MVKHHCNLSIAKVKPVESCVINKTLRVRCFPFLFWRIDCLETVNVCRDFFVFPKGEELFIRPLLFLSHTREKNPNVEEKQKKVWLVRKRTKKEGRRCMTRVRAKMGNKNRKPKIPKEFWTLSTFQRVGRKEEKGETITHVQQLPPSANDIVDEPHEKKAQHCVHARWIELKCL